MKRQIGFSLIELIMIIVVLSVISVSFLQIYSKVSMGLKEVRNAQIANALINECYEYLYQTRRDFGYAMNGVNNCNTLSGFLSYPPASVELVSNYSGSACPAGANCKLYKITLPEISTEYVQNLLAVEY